MCPFHGQSAVAFTVRCEAFKTKVGASKPPEVSKFAQVQRYRRSSSLLTPTQQSDAPPCPTCTRSEMQLPKLGWLPKPESELWGFGWIRFNLTQMPNIRASPAWSLQRRPDIVMIARRNKIMASDIGVRRW